MSMLMAESLPYPNVWITIQRLGFHPFIEMLKADTEHIGILEHHHLAFGTQHP